MEQLEMNLSELDRVLDIDFDLLEDAAGETIETWTLGHGMVEIGASCCSSGRQTSGSCKAQS